MTSIAIEKLDKNFLPAKVDGDVEWFDASQIGIEGRGFSDTPTPYDRLPVRAQPVVRLEVWNLSQHPAGLCCRFVTDATTISAHWKLRTATRLAMNHMTAAGMSGLDLYTFIDGEWKWAGVGVPGDFETKLQLASNLLPGKREYLLYFPLYNSLEFLHIGLPKGSIMTTAAPGSPSGAGKKPIVFYGTSITHGGCANRAGMNYVEILSRALRHPTINLGFSGNGPMEIELAPFMSEIDADCYVLDNLPNMNAQMVTERVVPFVEALRKVRPTTPILLMENIVYQRSYVQVPGITGYEQKNANLQIEYKKLLAKGIPEVYYLPGRNLLGDDGLGTVDGSHPTDLGFLRMAQVVGPAVKALLK